MELNVTILNFLSYKDKKTNESKVRIGYICNDKKYIKNTSTMKGYCELSAYVDDKNGLYDNLKTEMCGDVATLVLERRPSEANPFREVLVLKEIKTAKHGNISVL